MRNFRVTRHRRGRRPRLTFVTCFASAAHANGMRDLAPADEYFGRLRMSVLGIRNELVPSSAAPRTARRAWPR